MAGSVNAPANPPPLAVMMEYSAAAFTALSLQFVVSTPRPAFAYLARTTMSFMHTQPCSYAVFAVVAAKSAAAPGKHWHLTLPCKHNEDPPQSLQELRMRPCSHMLPPPLLRALHLRQQLLLFPCSQKAQTTQGLQKCLISWGQVLQLERCRKRMHLPAGGGT